MSQALEEQYKRWNKENKLLLFNATWHSTKPEVITARKVGLSFATSTLLLIFSCMFAASNGFDVRYPLTFIGIITGSIFLYQSYWAIRHKTLTPFGTSTFEGNHARDLAAIELAWLIIAFNFYMYWNYLLRSN